MPAYLYVMRSACTGRHEVGATVDLDLAFAQGFGSTGNDGATDAPWECVYIEICDRIEQAKDRVAEITRLKDADNGIEFLYSSRIRTRPNRD